MGVKLAFLLFSLQLWHSAMSNYTTFAVQSKDSASCVSSCNSFPIQIGSKLYKIESNLNVNWFQAANNCRKLGGHLLNVESSLEMDLISAIIPSDNYWISQNCLAKMNNFISLTTGERMPYNRWAEGEPSLSTNRKCVEIQKATHKTADCLSLKHYICQANKLWFS